MHRVLLVGITAVGLLLQEVQSFVVPSPRWARLRTVSTQSTPSDEENESSGGGVEDMRKILEASWNPNLMGEVPLSPELAAEAAGEQLLKDI